MSKGAQSKTIATYTEVMWQLKDEINTGKFISLPAFFLSNNVNVNLGQILLQNNIIKAVEKKGNNTRYEWLSDKSKEVLGKYVANKSYLELRSAAYQRPPKDERNVIKRPNKTKGANVNGHAEFVDWERKPEGEGKLIEAVNTVKTKPGWVASYIERMTKESKNINEPIKEQIIEIVLFWGLFKFIKRLN